jgi:hypothetical protein
LNCVAGDAGPRQQEGAQPAAEERVPQAELRAEDHHAVLADVPDPRDRDRSAAAT